MKKITIFILWFVLFGCSLMIIAAAQENKVFHINRDSSIQLRIDPNNLTSDFESEVFDSTKLVYLETIPESEFRDVDNLFITEDEYVIFEKRSSTIFIFKKNGKYQAKIEFLKIPGVKKYLSYPWYFNENDKSINFFNNETELIYLFDLEGEQLKVVPEKDVFIDQRKMVNRISLDLKYRSNIQEEFYDLFIVRKNLDSIDSLKFINRNKVFIKRNDILRKGKHFLNNRLDRSLFIREFDLSIYEIDSNANFHQRFEIILPLEFSLPNDFLYNKIYDGKRINFMVKNMNLIYALDYVYSYQNLWVMRFSSKQAILYNSNSKVLTDLNSIEAKDIQKSGAYNQILGMDKNIVYTSINFDYLSMLKQQRKDLEKYTELSQKEPKNMLYQKQRQFYEKVVVKEMTDDLKKISEMKFHNPILRLSYLKMN
ncbi:MULTISPECIES: hypothetical protein [Sphingobacterium]|uniref:6-bladed beta-propeller n=1 Tax=Sphingobacterium tenebrionis TaxID=3111775 RepID=A0ABU8IAD6_9SPHI|nr:hypothetical protein [Sphingobacterium sp. 1.A.4]